MSEKQNSLSDAIAVDTSVLVEFIENTSLGKKFFEEILSNPKYQKFYIAPIVDTELKYILCRRIGYDEAIKTVSELLNDFTYYSEEDLRNEAAFLKCNYAVSLADCYGLAVSKILDIPICMKKEAEIEKVYHELSSLVKIEFVDDLI
ncbi:MAG: PIN domain-containing protein [Promethearchaeota archaeon]